MARHHCRLTATKIAAALRRAGKDGLYADGGGLYLVISNNGAAASWVFRWARLGVERRMGLGSVDKVSLATARTKAADARALLGVDKDPLIERAKDEAKRQTFDQAAADFIEAMVDQLSPKQVKAWRSTLARYASPVIGKMLLQDIDIAAVLRVLQRDEFWRRKPKTADAVRARIEHILARAIHAGLRPGPNPAAWDDCLDTQLPAPNMLMRVQHHEALPRDELPLLMRKLEAADDIAAAALRFNLLTATRTGDIIGANWRDINFTARTWTISRTKNGDELTVPLCNQALALLREVEAQQIDGEIVFARAPGQRLGHQAMLRMVQEKLHYRDASVHGSVRAGFKTFFEERGHRSKVIEACLSHRVAKDDTEAAYLRTTFFEQRCVMMQTWGNYLAPPAAVADDKIVALR
jgi:integrase